ncbi:MAG: hypothetical protein AABX54_02765 [Nanoarchaeota archaeon]
MLSLIRRILKTRFLFRKLKGNVRESESKQIIFYNGKTYAIRFSELRNLGLDYRDEIALVCRLNGFEDVGFFSRACGNCKNSVSIREDSVKNCRYEQGKEIRFAVPYTNQDDNQAVFYAIRPEKCAFDDSLVIYLADRGLMEKYRVNIDFNFKPIDEFESSKIPGEFLKPNVEKRIKT